MSDSTETASEAPSEAGGPAKASDGRPFRPLLGVALLLFFLLLLFGGLKSYRDLTFARQRVESLEREIRATERRIDDLNVKVDKLGSDPLTLEQRAREDLGLVRPGDLVILLPDEGLQSGDSEPESQSTPR